MSEKIYSTRIKKPKHIEGDVWEENGKKWTIKNGITQTIIDIDSVRNSVVIPLKCPVCGGAIRTEYDKKFWKIKKRCMNCVVTDDTQKMINGTFHKDEKIQILRNKLFSLKLYKEGIEEVIRMMDSKQFVTECGVVEEWSNQYDFEENKEKLEKKLDDINVLIDLHQTELDDELDK